MSEKQKSCCEKCLIDLDYKEKNRYQCSNRECDCHTPRQDKVEEAMEYVGKHFGRALKKLGEEEGEGMEERFDERFPCHPDFNKVITESRFLRKEVKSFISSEIALAHKEGYEEGAREERKKLLEKINEAIKSTQNIEGLTSRLFFILTEILKPNDK